MPNSLAFSASARDLLDAFRIGIRLGAIGGRHVVIDHGERLLRRVHLAAGHAQAFERLRRGHLVHQMAVDIEQAGAVLGLVHQMVVPDLVVQGGRFGHELQLQECCVSGYARCARGQRNRQRSFQAARVSSDVAEVAKRPKNRPGSRERSSMTMRVTGARLVRSGNIPRIYSRPIWKREGFDAHG